MKISSWHQAWQTIEAYVAEHCQDQGVHPDDQMRADMARSLLDVEDVTPAVADKVRRWYGLA